MLGLDFIYFHIACLCCFSFNKKKRKKRKKKKKGRRCRFYFFPLWIAFHIPYVFLSEKSIYCALIKYALI